jgi:GNAT superfamily N-acetyltransferase
MSDLLVKLYQLPPLAPVLEAQQALGITVRRATAPEKHIVIGWVRQHFGVSWASQAEMAYAGFPITCFIAIQDKKMIGFSCCDGTYKGVFGPTGVDQACRGKGTGKALLLVALHDLWERGYPYAVIGWAGPADFYVKAVGASEIPDSAPGFYAGMLRDK